jgi:hypothetical protein
LTNIAVDPLNNTYSSVDGVLFDKNQITLIQYPSAKPGSFYAIPNSVANIGGSAFVGASLVSIVIPNTVTNIGSEAFGWCESLSSISIPSGVTALGEGAFYGCSSLTNATIAASVTTIRDEAFRYCSNLVAAYFQGNPPAVYDYPWTVFDSDTNVVYYLPGTTGWDSTYCDRPTVAWTPQLLSSDASFGIRTNQFSFQVNWVSGPTVVIETSTNLNGAIWMPLQTNTLSNGSFNFSDPAWSNYPARFYRVRSL